MDDVLDLNFLNDLETRTSECTSVVDVLIEGFQADFSKESRNAVIAVQIQEEQFEIRLNDLLFSLLLIPARFIEGIEYTFSRDDFLENTDDVTKSMLKYFNDTIEIFTGHVNVDNITTAFAKVIENTARQAWGINLFVGNSVNLYDVFKLMNENAEIADILNFQSNENSQFSEIESSVEAQTERLVELLKSDECDSYLKNMLGSISIKQFQQVFVNISLKPDLYGKIIERPINTSFFRGMRDSTDYYINATGARKALVVNATQVRLAGYLARKLALSLITTTLDKDIDDCGSNKLLPIKIETKDFAKRFTNRYYKLKHSDKEFKFTTNSDSTSKLVGKEILLASPITCGLSGNKVCCRCYGLLSDINQYHISMSAMLLLTEQIVQMLLSSKHLLQVSTEKIELPDGLEEYFEIDRNSLIAIKPCRIIIEELEDDEERLEEPTVAKMTLIDGDKVIESSFFELDLYMHSIKDKLNVDLEADIKVGEEAFRMNTSNNEISAPLKRLLKIIESEDELNSKGGTPELVTELINLLISSKIKLAASGIELIVRELGRNPANIQERSTDINNTYFLKLTNAIINSNSAAVSLAFERHKQLLEGNLFMKSEESIIDRIF